LHIGVRKAIEGNLEVLQKEGREARGVWEGMENGPGERL
jgi:hypothetical protein